MLIGYVSVKNIHFLQWTIPGIERVGGGGGVGGGVVGMGGVSKSFLQKAGPSHNGNGCVILTRMFLFPLTKSWNASVTCSRLLVFLKSLFTVPSSFCGREKGGDTHTHKL